MTAKVVIFSRQNCHLCHEAERIVREVLSEISFDLEVVNIDGNAELESLYGEEVPVTMINGERHAYFSVDRNRFRKSLRGIIDVVGE
jgi:glutaredoxin